MSEFSATGEAKVLTKLVESRIDPRQSAAEKSVEENAIQREIDDMTSLQLQRTISAFNDANTGMFHWTEIEAREVHANGGVYNSQDLLNANIETGLKAELFNSPITGVKFIPRGYLRHWETTPVPGLYDSAESFTVNLSRQPGSINWCTEAAMHSDLLK